LASEDQLDEGAAGPQAFQQQRPSGVLVDPDDGAPLERGQHRTRMPLVARLSQHFQDDGLAGAMAGEENRCLGLGDGFDLHGPVACMRVDSRLKILDCMGFHSAADS
jgi:hypothetical protein